MCKAALITGGGKRLGKAMSLYLADRGYNIALHYNSSDKEAKETEEEEGHSIGRLWRWYLRNKRSS
mgnify:CR=1 FL=1